MARRYSEHRALNMFSLILEQWEFPLHSHNFFEFIHIARGRGTHLINGFSIPYRQDSCFLITPEDEHEFIITETTRFEYMKFTESLLQERNNPGWQKSMLASLKNINQSGREIISDTADRNMVINLLQLMKRSYAQKKLMDRAILLDLFGALLSLVARNIIRELPGIEDIRLPDERIPSMLSYLRTHLTDKEKTSVAQLAATFNLSPAYVSEFFKKHTNETLQQFLMRSRLRIAESLLQQSDFTIAQIADKLAFNDSSHFNKAFRTAYGQSPGAFRRAAAIRQEA